MQQDPIHREKPRIGISGCLLGERVRFNGGHSRSPFITEVLDTVFDWVSFCPEVAAGMGTPREAVRLVGEVNHPELLGWKSKVAWTEALAVGARDFLERPSTRSLHGFILKRKSPTCGMERVPIYGETGNKIGTGVGLFARALKKAFPLLPMEEEGRLNDARLRESFVIRVYVYKAWCDMLARGGNSADLIAFHARQKMLLSAHDPQRAREMGKLIAGVGKRPLAQVVESYGQTMTLCLSQPPRRKFQANVLHRFLGFLKDHLSKSDRAELRECVDQYRRQLVPLSVPLTLLNHHLRKNPHPWANQQTYLSPYPKSLPLRHYI